MDKPLLPTRMFRKSILTKVAGVTFRCKLDHDEKRQDIIADMVQQDRIDIRPYKYDGETAYLIIDQNTGLDIGVVPSDVADEISEVENPEFEGYVAEIGWFEDDNNKEIWYATARIFVL